MAIGEIGDNAGFIRIRVSERSHAANALAGALSAAGRGHRLLARHI
ncbi:hypothetical protein [Trinickia fusca]|nr:hypothetical protein [Trinickia fusca]